MIKEKKTLLISRIVFGILLLVGIIVPLILWLTPEKDIDIIEFEDNGSGYFVATFSEEVVDADVDVAFYDAAKNFLGIQTVHFVGPGTVLRARINAPSKAEAYEALSYELTYESKWGTIIYVFVIVDIILLAAFVQSLTLSCKVYDYNGRQIIVYAGWMKRYMKVNGTKVDERSTMFTYTTINLGCVLDDGAEACASITRMNRISLRINNMFYQEIKK